MQPIVSGVEATHPDDHVPGTRFRIRALPETTSTNAVASEAASAGEREGLVVVADYQTAGRGRLGRTWTAPTGSALLCSFLLRPPTDEVHLTVTAVACAAASACLRVAGVEPGLKWPNDLVVGPNRAGFSGGSADAGSGGAASGRAASGGAASGGPADAAWRKLGGILAEAVTDGDRVVGVVVGLGLNVRQSADFPESLASSSTFLSVHSAQTPVPRDLLVVICEELETRCELLLERPSALMTEYRRRCATIGQQVRIEQPGGSWEGRAVDVADDGSLQVRTDSELRRVDVGDVVHLRPA